MIEEMNSIPNLYSNMEHWPKEIILSMEAGKEKGKL